MSEGPSQEALDWLRQQVEQERASMTTTPPEAADEHALVEKVARAIYEKTYGDQRAGWPWPDRILGGRAHWDGLAHAALAAARPDGEREAVVRWLKAEAEWHERGMELGFRTILHDAADAIEQGQHREQSR